jgi:hypothetical protein
LVIWIFIEKSITIIFFPFLTLEFFLEKLKNVHQKVKNGLEITTQNPKGQNWSLPLVRTFFQKMKKVPKRFKMVPKMEKMDKN